MACRFTELIIDARDPKSLVRFWADVLQWEIGRSKEDPPGEEIAWLKPPSPAVPLIVFVPVPDEKAVKNRMHIDVSPTDRSRDDEVERILALGARRADIGQGDVSWIVLADPEGNEFCLLRTPVD